MLNICSARYYQIKRYLWCIDNWSHFFLGLCSTIDLCYRIKCEYPQKVYPSGNLVEILNERLKHRWFSGIIRFDIIYQLQRTILQFFVYLPTRWMISIFIHKCYKDSIWFNLSVATTTIDLFIDTVMSHDYFNDIK